MSKHTPGPWTNSVFHPTSNTVEQVVMRGTETLASVYDLGRGRRKEFNANAVLVAHAPDLLQACETAVDQIYNNDLTGAIATLQAAAKKAKGE